MSNKSETKSEFVFVKSKQLPEGVDTEVHGYDFNNGLDYEKLFQSYYSTGIQATNLAKVVNIINNMIDAREVPVKPEDNSSNLNPINRPVKNCTIFFGYTSNMISSGLRDIIRYLAQHNLVDVIVTSAGGIEEDFIKCMKPSFIGDFNKFDDSELRKTGINRIGNMLVPNDNYVLFEQWLTPILDTMLTEQTESQVSWTPSKLIARLGREINNEESVYYWCYKNNIPVFCPAITDGSIGDMIFFHSISHQDNKLKLDIAEDIYLLNKQALLAKSTGMIILGGGVIKHQIANANLMRNGADFTVYINTGHEFEASDAGAPIAEAISWGKVRIDCQSVKLHAEASLVFPIIVAQTFAKFVEKRKQKISQLSTSGDIY